MHAALVAEELEIPRVVVPPIPGGFSALGLVASDVRRDYARTFYASLASVRLDLMTRAFAAMETEARQMLSRAGVPEARWEITRSADCRYPRQAYELTVPVSPGEMTPAIAARLAADFHARHRGTYGHASPDEPVQVVNLRVAAVGKVEGLDLRAPGASGGDSDSRAAAASWPARDAYFKETGLVRCPVIARAALGRDAAGAGPTIIEAADTTVVVPPGWRWQSDERGFITLERATA
jgi:N-methylhydantoinase A